MLRGKWTPGPAPRAGLVLISVTDYTADHVRDLPKIAWDGVRLSRLWPTLDGAVGHWLWTDPRRRRTGSVSLWESRQAMMDFVKLPVHVQIMRHYRTRGTLRSTTWEAHNPRLSETWHRAAEFLHK